MIHLILLSIFKFIILVIPVLLSVAYLTLMESKIMGYSQLSKGPNMVGLYGLLQPLADGLKLFSKELLMPNHVDLASYIFSPMLALFISVGMWVIIPFETNYNMFNSNLGMLFMFAFSSMSIYAMLMSGWSSNSKYSFLGSMSAAAQMMSYEVSLGLILFTMILSSGSLDLIKMINSQNHTMWYMIPFLPGALMFLVSCLAETNSAPFDLTEGESELVSGYNVEYASMSFAYFFLAEYSHMMFMSFLYAILFMGGGSLNLLIKASCMVFFFVWSRVSFPSFRYDQLMHLSWKTFLPLSMALMISTNFILWGFKGLPI